MVDHLKDGAEAQITLELLDARLAEAQKAATEFLARTALQEQTLREFATRFEAIRHSTDAAVQSVTSQAAVIEVQRARADEALKLIDEATRKAHSESGFAFNAKGNAEEHAKAIAKIRGEVEVDIAGLATTKKNAEEASQAIVVAKTTAEGDMRAAAEARATVGREAASVHEAAERISAVLPSIETARTDAIAVSAAKADAEASATALQTLQSEMAVAAAKATLEAVAIAKADEDSKALAVSMTDARTKANEANTRLNKYEEELKALSVSFSEMVAKIESVLPRATSAGLASAFHDQKARFAVPQRNWLILFVLGIAGLLAAGWIGLPPASDTWDVILRHFVNRLPFVAPLVWLAIYSGHQYNMALRMEEDYAFKEAVSTAFEGYKREMLAIPASADQPISPLVTLCQNVLGALAERPGRIYEGKVDVITPMTPVLASLKEMISEMTKAKKDPTA